MQQTCKRRFSQGLQKRNIRLVIAVDRVVDPLRGIVDYLNNSSNFQLPLLEVQQYVAPDGGRIASLNVYGGGTRSTVTQGNDRWDEARFMELLDTQASPDAAEVIRSLYGYATEQADQVKWGTGVTYGSVGFGVRTGHGTIFLFWLRTTGKVNFWSQTLARYVPRSATEQFLASLRSIGVEVSDGVLDTDVWPTFDASLLRGDAGGRFIQAIEKLRGAVS